MNKQVRVLLAGLGTLCVIVFILLSFCLSRSVKPIQEGERTFSLSNVMSGETDISAELDLNELEAILRNQAGKLKPGPLPSITPNADTIFLDGVDECGAVHFVLDSDRAVFYRSADRWYVLLDDAEALYSNIRNELTE